MNNMVEALIDAYKGKLPGKICDEVKKLAHARKLSEADVTKVLKEVKREFDNAKIHSGEAIGIITAESFGEPSTQMVLNVFHFAGVAELSVSQGLPRIIELLDARKTIKTPSMRIYLTSANNSDPKLVKKVAAMVKEIKLQEVASNFIINVSKLRLEIELNKKHMKERRIAEDKLVLTLTEGFKQVDVKEKDGFLVFKSKKEEENELLFLYKLKEKLKEFQIGGVKGISQVLPIKEGNEYVILTAGSNLKEVLKLKEIDSTRVVCNDIFEVKKVLGIEAARNALMNEILTIYEEQGLDIDIRHIMLISDVITNTGDIKGITRSGITGEKVSVLARASFETPDKHLINASLIGEVDELTSVVENVILNQPVPLGTGLPDLVTKMIKQGDEE